MTSPSSRAAEAIDPSLREDVLGFFEFMGAYDTSIDDFTAVDSYSPFIRRHLKDISVERGRVSCSVTVEPSIANSYEGLHGGAVAAIAERVSEACARTVVAEDKQLFLGELGMTYLSSAPIKAEVVVEASVVRSGRNITVVAVMFKIKATMKVAYLARATFYNSHVSKL